MGNPVNIFDFAGEDLAEFLAKPVGDGTWANVFTSQKVNSPNLNTSTTQIVNKVGALWGNGIDDFIRASYPLIKGAIQSIDSSTANAVALWDSANGSSLKNSSVTIDGSGNIATTGTVDGRDVSADGTALDSHLANTSNPHSSTIASVLVAGNSTDGTDFQVTNNDAIVGQDGGSISFTASSGAVTLGGGASETVRVRTSDFVPVTNNGAYLGNPSLRWIGIYSGSVSAQVLQGYDFGSGAGSGAAATFRGGNGGTAGGSGADAMVQAGSALAGDSKGGTLTIRSGNGSGTENAGNLQLGSGSVDTGDLGVVRITNTCLEIAEAAAVPGLAITAGYGRFWVENTTPSRSKFTDDAGNDYTLHPGVNYSVVRGSTARGSTNTGIYRWTSETSSAGTSISYTDSATDGGYWTINEAGIYAITASQYAGGDVSVAIKAAAALSNTFDETSILTMSYSISDDVHQLSWTGHLPTGHLVWIAQTGGGDPPNSFNNGKTVTLTRVA